MRSISSGQRGQGHRIVVLLLIALVAGATCAARSQKTLDRLTLKKPYRLNLVAERHVALFHWLDSLVGTSGGKTITAHRQQYVEQFGGLSDSAHEALQGFRDLRGDQLQADKELVLPGLPQGPTGLVWLRGVFLHFGDMADALTYAEHTMEPENYSHLSQAMQYFDDQYESIWNDGQVPGVFLYRFKKDPHRGRLMRLLSRIADSMDVDLSALPTPTIYLVPVPSGHGTHATAVGPYLLLEVRRADHLAEQASVIVHENSHYLFYNMNPARRARVREMIEQMPADAREAWRMLNEALPTALGQGVADREFRTWLWSSRMPWYHLAEVDEYAKAIFPLVDETLREGGQFDERFFRTALELYPGRPDADLSADR